jgi:hypothetical protein
MHEAFPVEYMLMSDAQLSHSKSWDIPIRNVKTSKEINEDLMVFRIIFKARTLLFMLGASLVILFFVVKHEFYIFFRSLMILFSGVTSLPLTTTSRPSLGGENQI